MNNFKFQNPTKVIFGKDTISQLGKEISSCGIEKVLLLYGKGSIFKNGSYDAVVKSLKDNNISYMELSGVKANPVLSKVKEAISIIKENNLEAIVALGGGSVIDSAKAICAGVKYEGDVWDMFEGKAQVTSALPFFTILTLSATGSEMNSGAVVTNEEEHKKWSFGSPYTYPKVSIIDPTLQFSLPKNQTVNGAIDAMSHVFELYFDGSKNTDVMDEFSEGILRTIIKHVQILINDPTNYESRAQLCWCATLALNGYNGTGRNYGDWASHQIEHSVSAYYDIAHGAGLAIVFPAWMKYVYKEDIPKFARMGEKLFNITEGSEEERAIKAIDSLKDFYRSLGSPVTLKELDIKYEDLGKLADNAAMQAPMGGLKKLDREDILNIYKLAYE